MSKDLNQCNFIGRLGRDIEIKYSASGSVIANFSIACGDDYKDKQGLKVEQTNWVNVACFGKLGEICGKYLKKGSQVYISGKQVTRKWQDQSGNDRYSTEIVANEMQMLGGRPDNQGQQPAPNTPAVGSNQGQPMPDDEFDSIPFR
ncbi:MAG: single-stranded DNA-binding protein [Planctomycetes bacterium]|nr:single-stranded DNA-binding protein [Planctomycetota bacterium]